MSAQTYTHKQKKRITDQAGVQIEKLLDFVVKLHSLRVLLVHNGLQLGAVLLRRRQVWSQNRPPEGRTAGEKERRDSQSAKSTKKKTPPKKMKQTLDGRRVKELLEPVHGLQHFGRLLEV